MRLFNILVTTIIRNIKGIIEKLSSRNLGVTAVAGAAAATGAVEIAWPIAAVAMAYIAGQTGGAPTLSPATATP